MSVEGKKELRVFFFFYLNELFYPNVWASRRIPQQTGPREYICLMKTGNSAVKWKRLTAIFTFTKQSVIWTLIFTRILIKIILAKFLNKASGYLLFFFLLTARNKCISGKHRKDEYSFLEKISLNLPLQALKNNHARILWLKNN